MRRFDKDKHIAKANLLVEERYLKSKGLIKENSDVGIDVSGKNFQLNNGKYYITGDIVDDYRSKNQHMILINLNGLDKDGTINKQTYGELMYVYNLNNDRAWLTMSDGDNIDIKKQTDSKWYPTFNKILNVLIEYTKSNVTPPPNLL